VDWVYSLSGQPIMPHSRTFSAVDSLSIDQNFPSYNNNTGILYITNNDLNLSVSLRNISYSEIYHTISGEKNYNIRLIDGGILQYNYLFDNIDGKLLRHRLAYFPSLI